MDHNEVILAEQKQLLVPMALPNALGHQTSQLREITDWVVFRSKLR